MRSASALSHWGVSLPDDWTVGQVKNVATVTLGKMLQTYDSGDDVEAVYIRAANVQPNGVLRLEDSKKMWFAPREVEALNLLAGDVVVVEGGVGGYGRAAYVSADLDGWAFQNSINRLRPRNADGRFIAYYLIAARQRGYVQAICNIVSMPHFTAEKLAAMRLPIPPVDEQRSIADYLDCETAQIDALISKQERLIERLQERRVAMVERTVFSGLDASVDFSRNEHEWLPSRSPSHWTLTQLGFRTETLAGYAFPSNGFREETTMTRLLRGINIKPGRLVWDETVFWDEVADGAPEAFRLAEGDLVLGMDRPFVSGGVRIAPVSDNDLPALLLQRVLRLRCGDLGDQGYLARLVSTQAFLSYLEPLFTGVSVPHMSEWQVRKFRAPFPPLDEQRCIASYLDGQTAKIDALIAKAHQFIGVSKERRSALITAAVTGQINVRKAS